MIDGIPIMAFAPRPVYGKGMYASTDTQGKKENQRRDGIALVIFGSSGSIEWSIQPFGSCHAAILHAAARHTHAAATAAETTPGRVPERIALSTIIGISVVDDGLWL
jgi:hypothetical protein